MSRLDYRRDLETHRHALETRERSIPTDTLPRLRQDDLQLLRTVGSFRIIDSRDLSDARARKLTRKGLLFRSVLYAASGETRHEFYSLTPRGRHVLARLSDPGERQRYWHGVVKPREVAHDLSIYPAYRKEVERIEAEGGKVNRVVMDFEFKAQINPRMNRREGPSQQERQRQIAEEFGLPLVDDTVMLPDCRIEYTDAQGREHHQDLEITTRNYRGGMAAAKRRSGFKLIAAREARSAIHNDHGAPI